MSKPLVAVRMLTYNHEKYIAQSIESVLGQQTNFDYKLVIGEDCSTDNTKNICVELAKQHPDKIILLCNERNDLQKNSRDNFEACNNTGAKYIALIEGDDYWTDNHKLQKQIDFLESHKDFAICFHNLNVYSEFFEGVNTSNSDNQKEVTTLDDLMDGLNYIGTASCIFRMENFFLPHYLHLIPFVDYFLHLTNARHGKIKYINQIMGTYRIHSGGMHGNMFDDNIGKAKAYQQHYVFWSTLKKYESFDESAVDRNIMKSCAWVIQKALETKNFPLFNDYNFKYLRAGGSLFNFLKNYIRYVVYFFRSNSTK
ncbi:hypothetical protein BH09BAC3_BH09BAC3_13140 [soil metagenome]